MTAVSDTEDSRARLRASIYWILIAAGVGGMLGRILAVDSIDRWALQQQRMNDIPQELERRAGEFRERGVPQERIDRELARIRTRLEERARIGRPFLSGNDRSRLCTVRALVEPAMRIPGAPYAIDKVIQEPGWDTIDMVKHDGHLYSSKPPLYPTLLAAQYWVIYKLTGTSLGTHPYTVGRLLIALNNLLPLVLYFWLLSRLAERLGTTDFARVFMMAAAVFGTFLTTFVVSINNHVPAAVCTAVVLYAAVRIWLDGQRGLPVFAVCGALAGLMVASELPSVALAGLMAMALLWKAPRPTLIAFAPAAVIVAAAFFGTNWIAHQSLKPAYSHRTSGDDWYLYEYERQGRTYKSYWHDPVGVDRGEASRPAYAFHVLIGHHGVFSLTPVWLLSVVGLGIWFLRPPEGGLRSVAALIGVVSIVVVAFYLSQPLENRNYGGVASGLRWTFWLAPLWLVAMLPALDAAASRAWLRWTALVLLALSALSVSYPTWNPWTHPWLMVFFQHMGWA
ncbi:MAG: hypothetical protein ACOY3P_10395 [Planctomycetota bacterium]